MARLKQLEPKKETIGGLNFYIRPFPAMVAANLTGDLASLLTPVLAALENVHIDWCIERGKKTYERIL